MQSYNNQETPNLIEFFKLAEHYHEPHVEWQLGCCYLEGRFVEKDMKQAKSLLLKASRKGNIHASRTLGMMFLKGHGFKQNINLAKWFLNKAANNCSAESQYELGKLLLDQSSQNNQNHVDGLHYIKLAHFNGIKEASIIRYVYLATNKYSLNLSREEIYRNLNQSSITSNPQAYLGLYYYYDLYDHNSSIQFKVLNCAVHYGHREAQAISTELNLYGENMDIVSDGASKLLALAKKGQAYAQAVIAKSFYSGRGCPKDIDIAFKFWQDAFQNGYLASINQMANAIYASEEPLNQKNFLEFKNFLLRAKSMGINESLENLAVLAMNYPNYIDNKSKEYEFFLKLGALNSLPSSMAYLANYNLENYNSNHLNLSVYWLAVSVDLGSKYAYYRLGKLILEQANLKDFFSQGIHFLQIAHEYGVEEATYELGLLYKDGSKYSIKNRKLAKEYFEIAVEKEHLGAKHQLAQMLSYGIGVPEDEIRADRLFYELSQVLTDEEEHQLKFPIKQNIIMFNKFKKRNKINEIITDQTSKNKIFGG